MAGLDTSVGNAALRIRYAKGLSRVLYDDKKVTPFYSRIARKKMKAVPAAFGSQFIIPVKWNDQQASSPDYATGYAKINGSSQGAYSEYANFTVPAVLKYAFARVSGPMMVQTENSASAFVDAAAEELDGQLRGLQRGLAVTAFGTGLGGRGTISARTATTITLTNKEDVVNFAVGQDIVAAALESSGALRVTFNTGVRILGVNPSTGVLTLNGDVTGGGGAWANSDTVFIYKEREDAASPTKQVWYGVAGWVPITAPTVGGGDSWCGLDRAASPQLHGHRFDGGGGAILDVLNDASQWGALMGVQASAIYMNPMDLAKILKAKEGLRHLPMKGETADVSFSGVEFHGANGALPILVDGGVKKGRIYFLDEPSFFVAYSGDDICHPVDNNGMIYNQVAGADAYLAAARTISNLCCDNPGGNMVVSNFA